ncbi:nitric oxide reductase D protein [Maritimibacter sp. 55A14]|uniref:nitric oxide reductase activation protein NorD n=1 Tax=Maritimibacter sp. 55A14 TaxID=2174844 RepID=UPI000D60D157|nr:VWA domain-containing protein [Maritimibacter sp. 55A14]PWE34335.1 nitric oxide reductase D protein [Maritimibacter sp. 55A14]
MGGIDLEPWEPEETVGKLWHAFASRLDAPETHEEAAVDLSEIGGRLAVFFRGLGGAGSVEIRPAAAEVSTHRLTQRRRLGVAEERLARASFDGAALRLPPRLTVFPMRAANGALYLWLAAMAARAGAPAALPADPLARDLAALRAARAATRAVLEDCPGLTGLHSELCGALRAGRPRRALPAIEAGVEGVILHLLGAERPRTGEGARLWFALEDAEAGEVPCAPRGYRTFLPVPLWPDLRPFEHGARPDASGEAPDGAPEAAEEALQKKARRRKADGPERRDSLILHKFEAILSFAEFLNLNRRVDDDDPGNAQKAARDADEIALAQISKAPAARLKLHLDLAPQEADLERISGIHVYPEWDARAGCYLAGHARVLDSPAEALETPPPPDPRAARRIRAVRRQFEALRPARVMLPGQPDGEEIDLDAAVRARADLLATGQGSGCIWRAARHEARDLAVSILLDISRSTESAVTGRAVIDIEREALVALAWGLSAAGDDCAISAFNSLRRDRVWLRRVKGFGEPMGPAVEARIAALRPGHYTRLGAALRHVSAGLTREARRRRLLLVITDGKPNDLDHYEGRHGIEDSRMAVREARRAGHAVHAVTIDSRSKAWFGRIFGRGGFSVVAHPDRLTQALPEIYRHLVA